MLSIRAAGALLPILVPLLLLPGTGVAAGFGLRCDDGPRKSWTTARQGWRPGMTARAPQLRRSPPRAAPSARSPATTPARQRSAPQPSWVADLYRTWGDPADAGGGGAPMAMSRDPSRAARHP